MIINYPKEYQVSKNIILPDNILINFVQSNWEKKSETEKIKNICELIKELETQMGLETNYPIQIKEYKNDIVAEFGSISEGEMLYMLDDDSSITNFIAKENKGNKRDKDEPLMYGIKIKKSHLTDSKIHGEEIFVNICHEMKHAEQKEIELGLIPPHSKEEYQRIQENSGEVRKGFYLENKSKFYRFFHPEEKDDKGLRYLDPPDDRWDKEKKTYIYYFQFTEREAYKFGYNMLQQLEGYAREKNLEEDLEEIVLSLNVHDFKIMTEDLEGYFGKYLNPNNLENFDYYKAMEDTLDLILHTIDTRECPENVNNSIWKIVDAMSKKSYTLCLLTEQNKILLNEVLFSGMKSIENNNKNKINSNNELSNFTEEDKLKILEMLGEPDEVSVSESNSPLLIEESKGNENVEQDETINLPYNLDDDLEL